MKFVIVLASLLAVSFAMTSTEKAIHQVSQ